MTNSEIFDSPSVYDERIITVVCSLLDILKEKQILTNEDVEKLIKSLGDEMLK